MRSLLEGDYGVAVLNFLLRKRGVACGIARLPRQRPENAGRMPVGKMGGLKKKNGRHTNVRTRETLIFS